MVGALKTGRFGMTVDVPPSILMIKKTKQHKAEIVLRMVNTFKHQWLFSNLADQMGCLIMAQRLAGKEPLGLITA